MTDVIRLQPQEAWTFARLPQLLRRQHITPDNVLHIGAHKGEEVPIYQQCGFQRIQLVEPDPRSLELLHHFFDDVNGVTILPYAITADEVEGKALLHYAERTVWTGLKPHATATGHSVMVRTVPITALLTDQTETTLLVVDTQGTELDLLRAAPLAAVRVIIVETAHHERLGGVSADYDSAVAYLATQGFTAVEEWDHDGSGYTDTVFVNA